MASTTARASRTRSAPSRVRVDTANTRFVAVALGFHRRDLLEERDLQLEHVGHLAVVAQRLGPRRLLVGRGQRHAANLEQLGRGEEHHVHRETGPPRPRARPARPPGSRGRGAGRRWPQPVPTVPRPQSALLSQPQPPIITDRGRTAHRHPVGVIMRGHDREAPRSASGFRSRSHAALRGPRHAPRADAPGAARGPPTPVQPPRTERRRCSGPASRCCRSMPWCSIATAARSPT